MLPLFCDAIIAMKSEIVGDPHCPGPVLFDRWNFTLLRLIFTDKVDWLIQTSSSISSKTSQVTKWQCLFISKSGDTVNRGKVNRGFTVFRYISCQFTDTTTDTLTRDTKNQYVIFESSKRELFERVNCALNVKKI